MKSVKRTPARALIATALLLLGLQFLIPFTPRARVSAQAETATANPERRSAAAGNHKLPDDLIALIAGRSLSELSDDPKLTLTDSFGAPREYAVLDNGFRLTNGHLLSNGVLFSNEFLLTNGHMLSNGFLLSNGFRLTNDSESFYADGTLALSGFTEGSLIFAPQATAIWSQAVVDPRGPGMSAGAESLARLASNDDTAISGVRYITSSSPFSPGSDSQV